MSQEHSPATSRAEQIIETARRLFAHYGWDNPEDLKMRANIENLRDTALSALSETLDSPAAKNEGQAALRLLAEVADAMDLSLGDTVSVAKMRPLVLARLESTPSATPCSGWILLSERRPKWDAAADDVLAYTLTGHVVAAHPNRVNMLWETRHHGEECFYTHWMPLPKGPL